MTSYTAQNLPYPDPTDNVRDAAVPLKELAQQVDARLGAHLRNITLAQVPPVGIVNASYPSGLTVAVSGSANRMTYNEALVDTGGMVDLSQDSTVITFTRTGFYSIGGYVRMSGAGGNPGRSLLTVQGTSSNVVGFAKNTQHDGLSGDVGNSCDTLVRVTLLPAQLIMTLNFTGSSLGSSFVLRRCMMWAIWRRN